jgi:hypothetical protein
MKISDIAGFVADYSPDQLTFKNYELPGFIVDDNGNEQVEAEELLAWVIDYSRQRKQWTALEYRQFNDDIQDARFKYEEREKKINANKRKVAIFRRIKFFYYLKLIFSLGLYGQKNPAPELDLDASIPMLGAKSHLFNESIEKYHTTLKYCYSYLRNNGYLHAKTKDYILYIYPSEKTIEELKTFYGV